MSSPDRQDRALKRRGLVGLALGGLMGFGLAGCGFQPLYRAPIADDAGISAAQALDRIDVAPIPNREGQILRNYLVQILNHDGRPLDADYRLTARLTERLSRLGIQSDSSATRANLTITTRYSLTRNGSGEIAARGSTRVVTSYNILQDEFATLTAERDARERALRQTSLNIRNKLALALIDQEQPAAQK